jgi:hypothetical protein
MLVTSRTWNAPAPSMASTSHKPQRLDGVRVHSNSLTRTITLVGRARQLQLFNKLERVVMEACHECHGPTTKD